jgi:hypothetical protein
MVINKGARIVSTWPTSSQHPRHDINVFANEESTRTKPIVESIHRLKGGPTAGKISTVNQARTKKISGTEVFSACFFLDWESVIVRVVKENPSAYEPKSGILFETTHNRRKEVIGWIAVVVRESNYLSLRNRQRSIMRPSKSRMRFNSGF